MDREPKPFAPRTNGRAASHSQLVVNEQGRKPLFGGAARDRVPDRAQPNTGRFRTGSTSENPLRRSTSEPLDERRMNNSSSSLASPAGSRIPMPKGSSSSRKPFSILEAWEKAAMEDDDGDETDQSHNPMDASPSPAPRVARAKLNEEQKKQMRKMLGEDHLDSKAPARPFSRDSVASGLVDSPEKNESPRRRGLYGKPRAGLGTTPRKALTESPVRLNGLTAEDEAKELRRYPSKDDLTKEGRIPALVPGIEHLPLPSIESDVPVERKSPEKSFAWQIDDDFTAGDLQVSDSPRIRVGSRPFAGRLGFDESSDFDINSRNRVNPGSRNTKLDEIRSMERKTGSQVPVERISPPRSRNTKLDEILKREDEAERDFPIPDRRLPRPKNTKLPEITQREIDGLSRRQLATSRLADIREQNAMFRSQSPEEPRPRTSRGIRETTSGTQLETEETEPRPKSAFEIAGERIPDTPVTVYKSRQVKELEAVESKEPGIETEATDTKRPGALHQRSDSRDLLRRLARAASSSPAPETDGRPPPPPSPPKVDKPVSETLTVKSGIPRRRTSNASSRSLKTDKKDDEPRSKPTVGFTGIPRNRSTDSVKSKASSLHSETDPTDRIEAEMNLFAPHENHSEKGSIRALSPEGEEDELNDVDATPRPKRQDPLTLPTPKVTGAYIETPATVKVEKKETKPEVKVEKEEPVKPATSAPVQEKKAEASSWRRRRNTDTTSEPETDSKSATTANSAGLRRRRTRSLPRKREPLKNTAKLPSVKDDLMELQRAYNIEDSTLDDFDEMVRAQKETRPRFETLQDFAAQAEADTDDDSLDFDLRLDTQINTKTNLLNTHSSNTSAQYHSDSDIPSSDRIRRMSKTLQSGLLGIHTVKRGIERLEDQVSQEANSKANSKASSDKGAESDTLDPAPHVIYKTLRSGGQKAVAIQIPVPRLYHRRPRFRITSLGIAFLLFILWFVAESIMCANYCKPQFCTDTSPCVFALDDPTFGTALPIKLDQWTTHGIGRKVARILSDGVADWWADMEDQVHGRRAADIDMSTLDFAERRQLRRRLARMGLLEANLQKTAEARQQKKWEAWRRAREEKERAEERGEEEVVEVVGGDERVWP